MKSTLIFISIIFFFRNTLCAQKINEIPILEIVGEKYGYKDKNNKITIPLIYDQARNFSEGIAFVKKGLDSYFINTKGKVEFKMSSLYEYGGDCKEDLIPFKQNNRKGFLNKKGKVVIAAKYFNVGQFNGGIVEVYDSLNWGIINKKGEIIVPIIFDQIGNNSKNLVSIRNRERAGFLDKLGNVVVPMIFDNTFGYSDYGSAIKYGENYDIYKENGIIKVKLRPKKEENPVPENYSQKLITEQDGYFLPPYYQYYSGMPELAIVVKNGKVGFINREKKIIIPFKYKNAYPFSYGLAAVFDGKKWGFIDINNNVVIPLIYDKVLDFFEGATLVFMGKESFGIDKKGKRIEQ